MKLQSGRFTGGLMDIFLNRFVAGIPSWTLRRLFYKALGMRIGKHSRIGIGTTIKRPRGICLGDRVIVNEYCHLDGRGGLTVDNDVSISIGVMIITATHTTDAQFSYRRGPVQIAHHVWLGARSIVLNDSVLAEHSIIGAGCVFKGVSEAGGVYIGNPAKLLRKDAHPEDYRLDYRPFFI